MERKFDRMEAFAAAFSEGRFEREYHGYFELFNKGEYYEAHDVLEHLWLQRKGTAEYNFFKALIQYAGCFVHLKKAKTGPAIRLFRLCHSYLGEYPDCYRGLDLSQLRTEIGQWVESVEKSADGFQWDRVEPPVLWLGPDSN